MGLFDEYRIVVHPILAGHGPTLFQGLPQNRRLELVSMKRFRSGVIATHYRPYALGGGELSTKP